MRIVVVGTPAPQGSKKFVGMRANHAVLVESSKKVAPWRKAVVKAATAVVTFSEPTSEPLAGPLRVWMTFFLARPKSHYWTGKRAGVLRESAPKYPTAYPDVSKLARSTEDALTDAGVWLDDAQVVEYVILEKRYVGDASPSPGAIITVERMPDA